MAETNDRNEPAKWAQFLAEHAAGDSVKGKVTSLVEFGAFVEVAPGVEGLLHESTYSTPLALGDQLTLRIDRIDAEARRMSLTPA